MQTQFPEVYTQYIASIFIVLLLIGFVITILLLYQKRKLVQEKEMESLKSLFEKELIQTRLEIQEDVLKNISMEIHDNIGQIMLLANVNISLLQTMSLPPEAPELIKEAKTLISKASEDLSQISRSMNSDRITEIGVFSAIKYELPLLSQKGVFEIQIVDNYENDGRSIAKETQLLVFRMFQEICNNIIKHAKATLVSTFINKTETGIELIIKDNGLGFDYKSSQIEQSTYNGVGLRSLQSRVKLFKGQIQINSILGQGTTISILIPVNEKQ